MYTENSVSDSDFAILESIRQYLLNDDFDNVPSETSISVNDDPLINSPTNSSFSNFSNEMELKAYEALNDAVNGSGFPLVNCANLMMKVKEQEGRRHMRVMCECFTEVLGGGRGVSLRRR